MSKTLRLIAIAAATALALPALAGSWPPIAPRKAASKAAPTTLFVPAAAPDAARATNGFEYVGGESGFQLAQHKYILVGGTFVHSDECDHAIRAKPATTASTRAVNGFEPVGGEPGWQLSQHKYVYEGGKWAHSDQCDHVIRAASMPNPADIERNRTLSPGA